MRVPDRAWWRLPCVALAVVVAHAHDASAAAPLRPVQHCQIVKLTAAAAELRQRLFCDRDGSERFAESACRRDAGTRRERALAIAERGGRCVRMRDADAVGAAVHGAWLPIAAAAVAPDDPAAARCAARQLGLAGRAVWDLTRAAVAHERTGDDARLADALRAVSDEFAASYARLERQSDCAAAMPLPAEQLFAQTESAVGQLRRSLCPTCGATCPDPQLQCDQPRLPREVAAMPLPGSEATGVNAREWIVVGALPGQRSAEPVAVVLPWDAPASAGPLPVPGCVLGAVDPDCRAAATIVAIGETDWASGYRMEEQPDGDVHAFNVMIGPDGEVVPLVAPGDPLESFGSRPGPGPIFFGDGMLGGSVRAVVWRGAGSRYEVLPADGFDESPHPRASDEAQRIVGEGGVPELPVLWTPDDGGYRLDVLPLLPGDTVGGALGIAGGRVVGWSRGPEGDRAVVWTLAGGGAVVEALPLPPEALRCIRADAISGARIVGACDGAGGRIAVAWMSRAGDDGWDETRVLAALHPGEHAIAHAVSGELVVGASVLSYPTQYSSRPVAWRLAAAATLLASGSRR